MQKDNHGKSWLTFEDWVSLMQAHGNQLAGEEVAELTDKKKA